MLKVYMTVMWLVYAALIAACINSAKAHDFYDDDCCTGKDCAPVADGTVTETGSGVVVSGFGTLSEKDKRLRWSKDERDHICAFQTYAPGGVPASKTLRCVYRKRKFM